MTRRRAWWGGAALAAIALGAVSFGAAAAVTATPEAHVQRYLEALAADDLVSAAVLAGLADNETLPWGDDGSPTVVRIVDRIERSASLTDIVAEYGTDDDLVTARFTLTPAPAHFGIVPGWQFAQPPVATISVGVDHHDRVHVNGRPLQTAGGGDVVTATVFVPSRVTATIIDPYVRADSASVRVDGTHEASITLEARPTAALEREVATELNAFLAACTEQQVLLPTGCPFGQTTADRVVGRPQWQLDSDLEVTIAAGDEPGRWSVTGEAEVRLTASVQRLRDGVIRDLDEVVPATVTGDVVLLTSGPRLTIYPPRD